MELNTKGRYAVMAMADLARHAGSGAIALSVVAERQKLPLAYLEQLFVPLRRAGLVESARGRTGGYMLAHEAKDISVAAVMSAVEEDTKFTRCAGEGSSCTGTEPCITHGLWQALSENTAAFLASVSLADLASGNLASGKIASKPRAAVAAPALRNTGVARTYLDYNATAPLRPEAKAAMMAALDATGNASSVHAEGRKARGLIEQAREEVARLIGAKPSEIVFTSGATEANAWVISAGWETIFASGIEHESILASLQAPAVLAAVRTVRAGASSPRHIVLPTGGDGVVQVEMLADHIFKSGAGFGQALVALQLANNETGVIQPVAGLAAFAKEHGFRVHTDAVQAAGRVAIDVQALGIDTLSLSAHKLGGPKGIGALYIRDGLDLAPLIRGGGQERRRRAGTENVAAIAGFGKAAALAGAGLPEVSKIAALRDKLEAGVSEISALARIIGREASRLANTSCIALPGRHAESLVIKLDLAGISVSAGSACSSGKVGKSHVLEAMGLGDEIAKGAIRVSLGPQTTDNDIAAFLAAWKTIVSQLALAA